MMKQNLNVVQSVWLPPLTGLLVLSLATGASRVQASSEPFSHIFVLGDSLSDTDHEDRLLL